AHDRPRRQPWLRPHGDRHRCRRGSPAPHRHRRHWRHSHLHFPHPARRACPLRLARTENPTQNQYTMKTLLNVLILAALATTAALADTKVKSGPRKGLILELPDKNAEFFVEKDRTISIAVYDVAMKAQAASTEVITATAEAP